MTEEQIKKYEYCKEQLYRIKEWKKKLPFGVQLHGCSSSSPLIEFTLEKIHRNMYTTTLLALNTASDEIQKIIDNL